MTTTSVDPNTFCPDLDDLSCMEDSLGFGDDDDLSCNESLDSSTLSAGSGAAMGTAAPMASLAPYTLPSELRSVASDPVFNAPRVLTNILSRQNLQTAEPTPDYFKTLQTEMEYHQQPDTTFPHYLACATTIFAFLSAIQFTLMPR